MDYNSSEQTISWFKGRYLEGTLEIKPPYQRRPVWAQRQKSNLIESILLRLPVPEVYIHQTTMPDGRTNYALVDGQQRIRAILQFIGVEAEEGEKQFNGFALENLETGSDWRNATFESLTDDQKSFFFGYKIAVRFLNSAGEPEVRDMFRRLNKYLTKLSDQELRNAIYSGPFVFLVSTLADEDYWAENRVVSPGLIRRMGDIEFISELMIGVMNGPQGGAGHIIDAYYAQFEECGDEFPGEADAKRLYQKTLETVQGVLPDIKSTRWRNRTDFYTLFVGLAQLLRGRQFRPTRARPLERSLKRFGHQVDRRLENARTPVPRPVAQYVRAVEKGSSDKARRATRHAALLTSIEHHFEGE